MKILLILFLVFNIYAQDKTTKDIDVTVYKLPCSHVHLKDSKGKILEVTTDYELMEKKNEDVDSKLMIKLKELIKKEGVKSFEEAKTVIEANTISIDIDN